MLAKALTSTIVMMMYCIDNKFVSAARYINKDPDIDTDCWTRGTECCVSVGYVPHEGYITALFSDHKGNPITWELDYVVVVYWYSEDDHPYYFKQHRERSDYYHNQVNYKTGEAARTTGVLGICVNQRWGHDEILPLHVKTYVEYYSFD